MYATLGLQGNIELMNDCCFGDPNGKQPTQNREAGKVIYVSVSDKVLTTSEFKAKLRRNKEQGNKDPF